MKATATSPVFAAFLAIFVASGAAAQDTTTNTDTAEPAESSDAQSSLSSAPQVGDFYFRNEFQDWRLRCIVSETTPEDPCQMYQLLTNSDGSGIAEITIVPVTGATDVAAVASVTTPLQTLLTAGVIVNVDGGEPAQHPFIFCTQQGCNSRFEISGEGLTEMQRGNQANAQIRALAAPAQPIDLAISLSGFTNAFEELKKINPGAVLPEPLPQQ